MCGWVWKKEREKWDGAENAEKCWYVFVMWISLNRLKPHIWIKGAASQTSTLTESFHPNWLRDKQQTPHKTRLMSQPLIIEKRKEKKRESDASHKNGQWFYIRIFEALHWLFRSWNNFKDSFTLTPLRWVNRDPESQSCLRPMLGGSWARTKQPGPLSTPWRKTPARFPPEAGTSDAGGGAQG